MKRFAVAYINSYDNDLVVDIVEADNIKDAISKHCYFKDLEGETIDWVNQLPDTLEEIKETFWNGDSSIDVKEIK